jgi:hypothetical protein
MGCNEEHGHRHQDHRHHSCGCGDNCGCGEGGCECGYGKGGFHPRYQAKAEQIAELEQHLGELRAEVQAVEERLADLRE